MSWSVMDVDGDGRDELIERVDEVGHLNTSWSSLAIITIGEDGTLGDGASLALSDRYPEADIGWRCDSTVRFVRKVIEVVGTRSPNAPSDRCPPVGRHRYRWQTGKLIELH